MDFMDSTPPSSTKQEDQYVTSINDEHETTCWGCGLRLIIAPYSPVFKCGWCGAITNHNARKSDNKYFWLRRLRDRTFVIILLLFMLFIIGSGVWAIYPVVFSMSYLCGVFHLTITGILSICTISTYVLAAFRSPGAPPHMSWGSYPEVGRGALADYNFCHVCSKPKPPSTHHCRSCGMCVLDMDHHCPFIGNCVGAGNHRSFILFLISAVTSTFYISIVSPYIAYQIWPPLRHVPATVLTRSTILEVIKESALPFLISVESLPIRGFVLIYLFFASVAVEIGLAVLLWQQLCYIYEGKTYLSQLSSNSNGDDEVEEKDCQNIVRFFGFPYPATRYVFSFWNSKKKHKK
ncbi:protein S-acyltransferase 11-like [Rutidosis leptorrhynchoides]|uniref:protein S-acyltransferase 11-like n=1 Tax=Rutidosis leptorrhynchoides TaxID=125765 RepID=UPI003A98D859